jgi:hypothetical protein
VGRGLYASTLYCSRSPLEAKQEGEKKKREGGATEEEQESLA